MGLNRLHRAFKATKKIRGSISIEYIAVGVAMGLICFTPVNNGQSATDILIQSINNHYNAQQNLSRLP